MRVNIMARITVIAAAIYRMKFGKGKRITSNRDLDWAANFANMLGVEGSTEHQNDFGKSNAAVYGAS